MKKYLTYAKTYMLLHIGNPNLCNFYKNWSSEFVRLKNLDSSFHRKRVIFYSYVLKSR